MVLFRSLAQAEEYVFIPFAAAYSQVNRFQYLCTETYPLLEVSSFPPSLLPRRELNSLSFFLSQLIWLVSGISADVFICGSMSWGLHKYVPF